MWFQPKPIPFRAVLWRGDINDLPDDWQDKVTVRPDGTLNTRTLHGPAAVPPDGQWWIREGADDELYPVRADVFTDRNQAVSP